MSEITGWVRAILKDSNYAVGEIQAPGETFITFENGSVLGFALTYPDPISLISSWRQASARVAQAAQFSLRRADWKAWNAYFVFLAELPGDYGQNVAINAIEEDLIGTRKIARAGVISFEECQSALLPLLPVQNAPRLEAIDMPAEIRLRTSELSNILMDAFLAGASDISILQLLESGK